MKVRYDRENDILSLRWSRPEKACALQFGDWLLVQVDGETGEPAWVQIMGFARLLAEFIVRARRVKAPPTKAEDCSLTLDKETDELWLKVKTREPLVQRQIDDRMIGWFNGQGVLKEICIPGYSRRWKEIVTRVCESFVREIEVLFDKKKDAAVRRSPLGELVSQIDYKRVRKEVVLS